MKLAINPDSMTLGDMEDFEEIVGSTVQSALAAKPVVDSDGKRVTDDKGRPLKEVNVSAKALTALVLIAGRADNPEFTLADARKVKITELDFTDGEAEDAEGNE